MKYILFFILIIAVSYPTLAQTEINVTANEGVGINITNPSRYFHVELPEFNNTNGIYSHVNYIGNSDVRAIESFSVPNPGYGIGGHFTGGFRGVYGFGDGGSYSSMVTPVYGVYARSTGTAGLRIGLFSEATGGDTNLAARFGNGDIEIQDFVRVNTVSSSARVHITNTDNIGINATALRVDASNNGSETVYGSLVSVGNSGSGRAIGYYTYANADTDDIAFYGVGNSYFSGDVRIGQNVDPYSGQYKLVVDGKILSEEVRVQNSLDWPDYVFKNDYHLKSLKDVEDYILKNSHLPNIPPAEDIEENGILLGEMQTLMMEKIEELTLYIIQQEKRIQVLEENLKNSKNEK